MTARQAPLFRFRQERPYIVDEVSRRVYREYLARARDDESQGLEYALNDAAYQELERLAVERGPEEEIRPRGWWKHLAKRVGTMSEQEKRDVLRELVVSYSEDIASQFNPAVYKLATEALPIGLGLLFKAQDLRDVRQLMPDVRAGITQLRDLSQRVVADGQVETWRALAERGTLLVVPTHSSNMDSILIGFALYQAGLPPVTYGAGKNLFSNPLTSYFMENLGAYKVDRRIKHDLYKHLLKSYAQVLLERGYHSLFFPGGTRSRSNHVEEHLKLGLLGASFGAYTQNLMRDGRDERIYVCPMTLNYNLVLEAESLTRDFLRREGGSRYFLEDDEFDRISTVVRFVMNTVRMDSTTVLRMGQPMDLFGNRVEADGESYDSHGRRVDPTSYVRAALSGEVVADDARDRQYTRMLGEKIGDAFSKETVLMPTQVVSYAIFEALRQRFPRWDVYRFLRMGNDEVISWEQLRELTGALLDQLKGRALRGDLVLSPFLLREPAQRVVEEGVEYLRMFHIPAPVDFHPDGIIINRLDLIYFYSNRLRGYEIDDAAWLARAARTVAEPNML